MKGSCAARHQLGMKRSLLIVAAVWLFPACTVGHIPTPTPELMMPTESPSRSWKFLCTKTSDGTQPASATAAAVGHGPARQVEGADALPAGAVALIGPQA